MFTTKWSTSERKADFVVERDVKVPLPDGTLLDGDIYRPACDEKSPVILAVPGNNHDPQSPPMQPAAFSTALAGHREMPIFTI